jgi:hypothetical protein
MRNPAAVWALLVSVLALGVLVGGAAAAEYLDEVGLAEAVGAVPLGALLALLSLSLARRARDVNQRTLGRAGGTGLAAVARSLGTVALLLAVTAVVALAFFLVLILTD